MEVFKEGRDLNKLKRMNYAGGERGGNRVIEHREREPAVERGSAPQEMLLVWKQDMKEASRAIWEGRALPQPEVVVETMNIY